MKNAYCVKSEHVLEMVHNTTPPRFTRQVTLYYSFSMKQKKLVQLIFWISLLGTLGSLYVSYFGDPVLNIRANDLRNTLLGIAPCTLCWYTRLCLFPLVLISWVALQHKDRQIRKTILPFGILWLITSVYIYGLEMNRWEKSAELCGINSVVPCGNPPMLYGGRFTLAAAGIISFSVIIRACLRLRKHGK